jgi:hypothetical protein
LNRMGKAGAPVAGAMLARGVAGVMARRLAPYQALIKIF